MYFYRRNTTNETFMRGFRVGSISGFEIRIDLSWFIIFFLILWTLSSGIFPAQYPDLSTATHIIMGIVGTVLFFGSLLVHELSHSLVARTKGIPVEGITLFIFGGISRTRMDAERPGDEFQIAGIGPLVSLVLAIAFGVIQWIGSQLGWSSAVVGVAQYLAYINFLLAIFNLLPGFPLDGGRLFRSIIWKFTGDLRKATRIASIGGQFLGYFLIGLGIVQMFQASLLGGLWFVFIGWFLNTAAEASYQQQLLHMGLEGLRARQVMSSNPETVPPDISLHQVIEDYFMNRRYQAFPVTEQGELLGVVTLNQVKETPKDKREHLTVRDVMTSSEQGVVVHPDEKMTDVIDKMQDSQARRVLVARDGQLDGIITASDITGWLRRVHDLEGWQGSQEKEQEKEHSSLSSEQ